MTPEHDLALCIHSYYVGELETGRRACERLLSRADLPEDQGRIVRSNRLWYAQTLDELAHTRFLRIDVGPAHDGWSTFNPTLLRHRGELIGIVRSSNYRIVDGRYEMPPDDNGVIRTDNILVRFHESDPQRIASAKTITGPFYERTPFPVDGLEDCRLASSPAGVRVSATVRNVSPFDGRCRMATADLDLDTATLSNLRVITSEVTQDHEKNWMPVIGRPQWLYACWSDGRVVTVDEDELVPGGYRMLGRSPATPLAKEFRGGSQLVPFDEGYLCVVHEVAYLDDKRAYEHRFVWFDGNLKLSKVSTPFAFREPRAIEFAAGLVVIGDDVTVSFGVRDAEAWLVTVKAHDIHEMLRPVGCDWVRAA